MNPEQLPDGLQLAAERRSQHDADSAELRRLCADRDAARKERDALRARLAEIDAQEPVCHLYLTDYRGYENMELQGWETLPIGEHKLYACPVPAQAVPTGPRQAVLLTDEQIARAYCDALGVEYLLPTDEDADQEAYSALMRVGGAIQALVLSANNLEVRRG